MAYSVRQLRLFVQRQFESEEKFGSAVGEADAIPVNEVTRVPHNLVNQAAMVTMDSRPGHDDSVAQFEARWVMLFCHVTHDQEFP
jgi:hypothetical protein